MKYFRQLQMESTKPYDIPDEIRAIEFDEDSSNFLALKNMIPESRYCESKYIQLLSAMVYLEEAANSRRVQNFNLENVQLTLHSNRDGIFTTEYVKKSMPDFNKAIKDSILDGLTIKPIGPGDVISSGKIIQCDDELIYIKIDDGIEDLMNCCVNLGQQFNVTFFINRTTYQTQHNALMMMQEHKLFPVLIRNPLYDHVEVNNHSTCEKEFR